VGLSVRRYHQAGPDADSADQDGRPVAATVDRLGIRDMRCSHAETCAAAGCARAAIVALRHVSEALIGCANGFRNPHWHGYEPGARSNPTGRSKYLAC